MSRVGVSKIMQTDLADTRGNDAPPKVVGEQCWMDWGAIGGREDQRPFVERARVELAAPQSHIAMPAKDLNRLSVKCDPTAAAIGLRLSETYLTGDNDDCLDHMKLRSLKIEVTPAQAKELATP